jgi:hypothetical protein
MIPTFPAFKYFIRAGGGVMVKALHYKPEGHGFETQLCERFLSIFHIFPATISPGVYSASSRNDYQKKKNNVSGE